MTETTQKSTTKFTLGQLFFTPKRLTVKDLRGRRQGPRDPQVPDNQKLMTRYFSSQKNP